MPGKRRIFNVHIECRAPALLPNFISAFKIEICNLQAMTLGDYETAKVLQCDMRQRSTKLSVDDRQSSWTTS